MERCIQDIFLTEQKVVRITIRAVVITTSLSKVVCILEENEIQRDANAASPRVKKYYHIV